MNPKLSADKPKGKKSFVLKRLSRVEDGNRVVN